MTILEVTLLSSYLKNLRSHQVLKLLSLMMCPKQSSHELNGNTRVSFSPVFGLMLVDGNFTSWSEWTGCSSSCGDGTAVRYRSCSNPTPANGGQDCLGDVLQTKACTGVYCPGMLVSFVPLSLPILSRHQASAILRLEDSYFVAFCRIINKTS